jgi:type IV secretory pathway protease TraF
VSWDLNGRTPPILPSSGLIPADNIFVVGDNALFSVDSRDYGLVPSERLIGKIWK